MWKSFPKIIYIDRFQTISFIYYMVRWSINWHESIYVHHMWLWLSLFCRWKLSSHTSLRFCGVVVLHKISIWTFILLILLCICKAFEDRRKVDNIWQSYTHGSVECGRNTGLPISHLMLLSLALLLRGILPSSFPNQPYPRNWLKEHHITILKWYDMRNGHLTSWLNGFFYK